MKNLVCFQDDHFIIDMMYARVDNIMSRAVYEEVGFGNKLLIHPDLKEALLSLVPELEKMNCKMRICDGYRPPIAHQKCIETIPVKGFFAADYQRSNHCHGTAVDVCLTDISGNNLVYPTEVDAYDKYYAQEIAEGRFDEFQQEHLLKARHDYMAASEEAIMNREALRYLMESHGFESIMHEWWHYNLKGWQNYPVVEWNAE